jgi:hypothetical protein
MASGQDDQSGGVLRTVLPGGHVLATEWAGDGDFRQLDPRIPPGGGVAGAVAAVHGTPVARAVAECFGNLDVTDTARLIRAVEFAAMLIGHQPCQCPGHGDAACVRCAALGELRAAPRRPARRIT